MALEETFESIENYLSRIMPQVISCPREIAIDALQGISTDFFKETRIWITTLTQSVAANTSDVELEIPTYTELVGVEGVRINDTRCCAGDYTVEHHTIHLHNMTKAACVLSVDVVLRPSRFCAEVPERLFEEYGDIIVAGALAQLKAMQGEVSDDVRTVPWSDPDGAKFYLEVYLRGLNRAKMRAHILRGYGMVKPKWR